VLRLILLVLGRLVLPDRRASRLVAL